MLLPALWGALAAEKGRAGDRQHSTGAEALLWEREGQAGLRVLGLDEGQGGAADHISEAISHTPAAEREQAAWEAAMLLVANASRNWMVRAEGQTPGSKIMGWALPLTLNPY